MISVITINLNNHLGLMRTAHSLALQLSREFEWLVVDGGSTDQSSSFIQTTRYPFPVHISSRRDNGIYDAMNRGARLARSEYLIFLNSGDTLASSQSIQMIVEAIAKKPDSDLLLFGFRQSDRARLSRAPWWRFWSLPTSHQAIVYKRNILVDFPYDTSLRYAGDYEHFLKVLAAGRKTTRIDEILIENEPYGSDQYLAGVEEEYYLSLRRYIPAPVAKILVAIKFCYINLVLFSRRSKRR